MSLILPLNVRKTPREILQFTREGKLNVSYNPDQPSPRLI